MSGIFEEQLRIRAQADEEMFSNAFTGLSEAVSGMWRTSRAGWSARDALQEIALFYRVPFPFGQDELEDMEETLDENLETLFRPAGVMRRAVRLAGDWYRKAVGAYLAETHEGQVVALLPCWGGYRYMDRSSGKNIRLNRRTAEKLKPEAIAFYRALPSRELTVWDLIAFMAGGLSFMDIALVALLTALITAVSMAVPFLTRNIYSQIIHSDGGWPLISIFVFLVSSGVSAVLLQVSRNLALSRIEIKTDVSVRAAVMARLINLPAKFFQGWASGDLARRAEGVNKLCLSIARVVFDIGLTTAMSLIYAHQIFLFTPVLVWPALGIVGTLLAFSLAVMWVQADITGQRMKLRAREQGLLYALLMGIQKLKQAGAERRAFAKWATWYRQTAKLTYSPPLFLRMAPALQLAITLTGTFILYARALAAGVAIEDYMAFMASWGLMSGAFMELGRTAISSAFIGPITEMAQPIMEAVPETGNDKKNSHKLKGEIEIEDVTFRYGENLPFVLRGLSLKIEPEEYVAIVGKSGCGKSTFMRLLLGFEQPQNGVVYYDGRDIKWLDLKSLRSQIGCVMQDSRLFPGSILSNILISAPGKTEEDAWRAAEMAGIAEDIRAMPMKMNTVISEGMGTLSGGQRQRLIIARAIAPRPKILLFDEATSALDNLTQRTVSESLESLKCTRIVIAHRLSTVRRCGRILVLDGGSVAEEGDYEALMEKGGIFASLARGQTSAS